jgi:hypothetical protein
MKTPHLSIFGSLALSLLLGACASTSPNTLPVKQVTLSEILYDSRYLDPYERFGALDTDFWSTVQEPLIAAVTKKLTTKGYRVTDNIPRNRASGRSFPLFAEDQQLLEDEWSAMKRKNGVLLTLIDFCQAGIAQDSPASQDAALLGVAVGLQIKRDNTSSLLVEEYVTVAALYLYQAMPNSKPRELWRGQSNPCTTSVPLQSALANEYTDEDRQARLRCLIPTLAEVLSEFPVSSGVPREVAP